MAADIPISHVTQSIRNYDIELFRQEHNFNHTADWPKWLCSYFLLKATIWRNTHKLVFNCDQFVLVSFFLLLNIYVLIDISGNNILIKCQNERRDVATFRAFVLKFAFDLASVLTQRSIWRCMNQTRTNFHIDWLPLGNTDSSQTQNCNYCKQWKLFI